jgi:hypothetical protein
MAWALLLCCVLKSRLGQQRVSAEEGIFIFSTQASRLLPAYGFGERVEFRTNDRDREFRTAHRLSNRRVLWLTSTQVMRSRPSGLVLATFRCCRRLSCGIIGRLCRASHEGAGLTSVTWRPSRRPTQSPESVKMNGRVLTRALSIVKCQLAPFRLGHRHAARARQVVADFPSWCLRL